MARHRPRSSPPARAVLLLLAACAGVCAGIPFGVAGHGSAADEATSSGGNAALRPFAPTLPRSVELLNTTTDSVSVVKDEDDEDSAPTPVPRSSTATPEPTTETPTTEPSEDLDDDDHGAASSDSGSMAAHRRSVPAPTPSKIEAPSDGGPETSGTIKRTNVIAFDVVTPQSAEDDKETTREETSRPPLPPPGAPAAAPSNPPTQQPAPPAPGAPAPQPGSPPQATPAAASTPVSAQTPPPPPPAAPTGVPSSVPPNAVPSSLPPAAAPASFTQAPNAPSGAPAPSSSQEPRTASVAPTGMAKPAPAVLGDGTQTSAKGPVMGHASSASSSHDPTVGEHEKSMKDAAGSGSASTSTETSTTSESSYYSMGTASILSIVGVIVGICVIIAAFVLISRREYEDDDDDRDVLGYGGDGGFKIGDRPTIVRLSPTFLMNGAGPGAPGQPMEPDFSLPSPLQYMGSNRGVPGSSRGGSGGVTGSNRGYAPTGAVAEESPAILESSLPPPRGGPSNEGGRSPSSSSSGFQHSDDISTLDSRGSDGWSSVMESDFEMRSDSRCTRDTTFSNITMSQNLSEVNSWDFTSQHHRTGSGRGTFRTNSQRAGGSRGMRSVPRMPEYDLDEEDDDTSSVVSYDVDAGKGNGARSTGFSSYRSSAESQFSDYRSTAGFTA